MTGHTVRRRMVALGGAVALAGSLLGWTGSASADPSVVEAGGPLSNLSPATANPTDGASGEVIAIDDGTSTTVIMVLSGLDPSAEGQTFGAHVHTGPCVDGNGAAAGPHFNIGATPSPTSEVWLDFTVLPGGWAVSQTTVPFTIPAGAAQAVVIHAQPTQAGGATPGVAGGRMACLPVAF
jgi:Cu/Zn superoxide dismutase